MSYQFPKGVENGHEVTLVTGVVYVFNEQKKRWDVQEVADHEHSHGQYVEAEELDELTERVEHLETTVADHRFIMDAGSTSDGMIVPLRPGGSDMLWENISILRIAKVDADGRPVSMEQVYPSIAIRLVDYGNSGHFVGTVNSVSDEGDHTSLGVTASHGVGAPVYGDEVVLSVFPPGGETDLSLYVTQDQLASGLSGKAPSSHSHNYASPSHSHDYATLGHSHGGYLPLTGGTLTGDLDSSAKIKADNGLIGLSLDSGQSSNLLLKHNGQTKVYVGSALTTFQEKVKLNKEGTDDDHAVTKGYVDSASAAAGGVDLDADYSWNGTHRFYGGETTIVNTHGPLTFDGSKSDYSGESSYAFMKFRENANSTNWMYFGPTSAYWETRWTLGAGEMTFAQTQTSSPSVKIDKNGLQVNGSSVSRNATLLTALRSSNNFDEVKAKLIELLEAEE